MTLEFRRCLPGHLMYIDAQRSQKYDLAYAITTEYAEAVTQYIALSAWDGYECVGAAGLVPVYPHRAMAWAMLSPKAGRYMLPIARKMRSVIDAAPVSRVEMTVDVAFEEGKRLAGLVGMKLETPEPLRKYGAKGNDEFLYARVR